MNQNIDDVIKNIDKKKEEAKKLLIEIRKLLEQLESTGKPIQNGDTLDSNLQASDEEYIFNEDYNSAFNNSSSESGLGSGINVKSNVIPSQIENQFDTNTEYTTDDITLYYNVASNDTSTRNMSIEDKYNIIINAEERRREMIKNNQIDTPEYKKLDEMFQKCQTDNYCQKIKNMRDDIQKRHEINKNIQASSRHSSPQTSQESSPHSSPQTSQESSPQSSPQSSQHSTPRLSRQELKEKDIEKEKKYGTVVQRQNQNIERRKNNKVVSPTTNNPTTNKRQKLGGKRKSTMKRGKQNKKSQKKSTMKRGKQNKKSQKKSKSHKKSRTHKKRH